MLKKKLLRLKTIILAPTTILVEQLYVTFSDRLSRHGIVIASVSRLKSKKELRNIKDDWIRLKRELESGWFQWIQFPLPASVSIQSGLNTPRYPSLKGIMGAKKKEIKTTNKADLDLKDSLQKVTRIYNMETDKQTEFIDGDPDSQVARLLKILQTEVKVLGA